MNLPFLGNAIDERFLEHRRRSTSLGGIVAASFALLLFAYRYYHDGIWSNDLLAVGVLFVVVKIAVLVWYRMRD